MKDCKKIHPLLSLHAEGALSPPEAQKVEGHLAACPDARREWEAQRKLRDLLLGLPEPPVPVGLHERIMARVTGKARPPKPSWSFPLTGLAAAACLMLYLVLQNPEWTTFDRANLHPKGSAWSQAPTAIARNLPVTQALAFPVTKGSGEEMTDIAFSSRPPHALPRDLAQKGGPPIQSPAARREKKMERTEPSPPNAALAVPENKAPLLVQDQLRSSEAPMSAQAGAAPQAFAPVPTPAPTEGAFSHIVLSKSFTASTWSGNNGTALVEGGELITDPTRFEALWEQLRPGETLPSLDFSSQALVFLNAGEEPTAGYRIGLERIEEGAEGPSLIYRIEGPRPEADPGPTHPWTLQVIPKPSRPVRFQKD